ncbi:peroxiredoxin [Citromicrobium bathyomarinum]|uniref:Peroxiredoxin n=1 Tax=Tsuneonella suprasediminis TaxID=2306996 RepID=A0A419R0X8_9SPHN|nr:peroxiredoxin [Tsuneonella suprasediminis]RJX67616.1 peroxiredoxin [Tsuneonella suprasediminis]
MTLSIGSTAPNFTAQTTQGSIHFHDWMGDSWAILFSHPKAFTPVCTTELGYMAGLGEEFAKRDTKILGLSVDSSQDNRDWLPDIEEVSGNKIDYPVVGDSDLQVAKLYNMLPADEAGNAEGRTAADNATVRAVYIIGPDKKIRAVLLYPMSSGRNFDEVLRLLDSVQLTERKGVATPVNWQKGDDVIIPPSLSDEDAKAKYPDGWDEKKPYLRVIQEPID